MGPAIDASPSVLRMIEVIGWLAGKMPSATRTTHTLPLQNKVFYVKPLDGDGKGVLPPQSPPAGPFTLLRRPDGLDQCRLVFRRGT